MRKNRMIKSIIDEYGIKWITNRVLYSLKLKSMETVPGIDQTFEKKPNYCSRVDLFSVDIEALKTFLQTLGSREKRALINDADSAIEGRIKCFNSIYLDYGDPINWHLNPLTGKQSAKNENWYSIPDFDDERGDIKVIWEVSRFSHFLTFARAFLLTDNLKYYEAFSQQLDSWLRENVYGRGANFKCGQECSFRMVNTLLAYSVFNSLGLITDHDTSNVKDLVNRCYRKVLSNFSYAYKCIKNNHTISELMGMIVGAWCSEDRKHIDKAFKMLDEVIAEQFSDDGGYKQFSFNYQRLALQDLECVQSLEEKLGRGLSSNSKKLIEKSSMLMYQCQDDSWDMPNYGSNDGALVFPITSCEYRDFRPVINTAYALVTGKQLYEKDKHQEELIWFCGGKALDEYEYVEVKKSAKSFKEAGLFTLRHEKSWAMIVLDDYKTRPAHMDQLHFDLWVRGINVLCDSGTYSYADSLGKKLADNRSHNTASVDGISQMNTYGPFLTYDWSSRGKYRHDCNYFEGEMKSKNGYNHKRVILYEKGVYHIRDKLYRATNKYCLRFHTPCQVAVDGNSAILSYGGMNVCKITSNSAIRIEKSERSLFYLRKTIITCICIDGVVEKGLYNKTEIEIL